MLIVTFYICKFFLRRTLRTQAVGKSDIFWLLDALSQITCLCPLMMVNFTVNWILILK